MHIPNNVSKTLCDLVKNGSCESVSQSNAANFFKVAKFSEIGFGYFFVNAFVLIWIPQLLNSYFWIATCTLPFTLWSVRILKSLSNCLDCWCFERIYINSDRSNTANTYPERDILTEWYEKGRQYGKSFFNKYNLDITTENVLKEVEKHRAWHSDNRLQGTPTVLINGIELVPPYSLEDYYYFPI